MSNSDSVTTYWVSKELAGYAGPLLRMGLGQTPLLNKIGGLGNNAKQAKDWRFIQNNQYSLDSPSQKSITETDSLTIGTPRTHDKAQDYGYCQVFQYPVTVSYQAQSATNYLAGLPLAGEAQEPTDPLQFEIRANMEQMALDIDWHMINGTANAATNAGTAWQMGGLKTSLTSNAINADSMTYTDDVLSTKMIDDAILSLKDTSKAPMQDMWVLCNAGTQQKLSKLYGNAPFTAPGNTIGGQAIDTINTDFGQLKVMYEPQVAAGELYIVDMVDLAPVFLPVPGKGAVFYEPLAQTGAGSKGQLYAQVGFQYVAEEHHSRIYGFDLT